MSLPIVIAARAEQDMTLQYQWYLRNADAGVAERYLGAVDGAIHRIASQPDIGMPRRFHATELQGIRSFPANGAFGKHLIFYRAAECLSIERIMHGARDLPRRLTEEPSVE